jgi:hypothetical protein
MPLTPLFTNLLRPSRSSPRRFVTDIVGDTPEPWQAEALDKIATYDRVAIRSGHGVGKTRLLAWVGWWWLCTRFPCKVPVVANSQDQLRDTLWTEFAAIRRKMLTRSGINTLAECYEVGAERIYLKAAPELAFAVARTASKDNPEALQGFHSDHLLFLIDEASGIPDVVFEIAMGALSTEQAKVMMPGNPTRSSGFFYDAFHGQRDRWETMHVSSEDVPRARGHIEDVAAKYGKESNVYRVRVLGEFPREDDDSAIPLHLCEAAVRRDVEPTGSHVWGVDVARFGSDRSALARRCGNVQVCPVQTWAGLDTMALAGRIKREYDEAEDRPDSINVDVIGLGAGVVDRLGELGLPVSGINVAETASSKDLYMRLRDELWFEAREWLARADSKLCDDPLLIAEMTGLKYRVLSSGKIQVESKDDAKKRGIRSPDAADAWMLTFATGSARGTAKIFEPPQTWDH